ncbi:hypothetical protein HK101_011845 [Irineochytrium annulatum]|nr:hypothetical protein HK101_011845 [Irineochytrium annulatum]
MSAYNQNHGVGRTLLDNWVEGSSQERAVGDRVADERSSVARLSKQGHAGILTHAGPKGHLDQTTPRTTHQETFATASDGQGARMGKRREIMEAELMKRALNEMREPPLDRSANGWKSTAHADFKGNGEYRAASRELSHVGSVVYVDSSNFHIADTMLQEEVARFKQPITFWSAHAATGSGTVICSTSTDVMAKTGGAPSFGKHTQFSTPI